MAKHGFMGMPSAQTLKTRRHWGDRGATTDSAPGYAHLPPRNFYPKPSETPVRWDTHPARFEGDAAMDFPHCPKCGERARAAYIRGFPAKKPAWFCAGDCGWWHEVARGSVEAFAHVAWMRRARAFGRKKSMRRQKKELKKDLDLIAKEFAPDQKIRGIHWEKLDLWTCQRPREHTCAICGGLIEKGDRYRASTKLRAHESCIRTLRRTHGPLATGRAPKVAGAGFNTGRG